MQFLFLDEISFDGDISKWDVSRVVNMNGMFKNAAAFNGDISKWDVSRVKDMNSMFHGATSFNGDISRWKVRRVRDMDAMFYGAARFEHNLCTAAWVGAKSTSRRLMFKGSPGSISATMCAVTTAKPVFSPQSRTELRRAVNEHLVCEAVVCLNT